MRFRRSVMSLAAFLLLGGVVLHARQEPAITVTGFVERPLALTAADLAAMPRASVSTTSGAIETRYEGVWVHEILRRAGVPLGEELRGPALAAYVLARAEDGYRVAFSLGELDPAFFDSQILLADTANGQPLGGTDGRFRIVAPQDGRAARSIRMLTSLEVVRLED